jgi:hypothetical protein
MLPSRPILRGKIMTRAVQHDIVLVTAGGRMFIVGLRSACPLFFSAKAWPDAVPSSFSGLDRDAAFLDAIRQLHARAGGDLAPMPKRDQHLVEWLTAALAEGRLLAVEVPKLQPHDRHWRPRPSEKLVPWRTTGGLLPGAVGPHFAGVRIRDWPLWDRFVEVIMRAAPKLPGETGILFKQMLSPDALTLMAGTLAFWASSHAIGIGLLADATLVGFGFALAGWAIFDGLREILASAQLTAGAASDADLDEAASALARAITTLGVNTFLILLTRIRATATARPAEANMVLARWEKYLTNLKLSINGRPGALWSRLGEDGQLRAAGLARRDGRITLEMILRETDFFFRYEAEFGASENLVTKRIWELISAQYVRELRGKVVVYTEQHALRHAKEKNPIALPELRGPTNPATEAAIANFEARAGTPVLGLELDLISSIEANPSITEVVIVDVRDPSKLFTWTRQQLRQFRAQEAGIGVGARH